MIIQRIARALRSQDWVTVMIEFVLVIVGVLIALQLDNWNDDRAERRHERVILVALQEELRDDLEALGEAVEVRQALIVRGKALIAHIDAREPYAPELDAEFGAIYNLHSFTMNRASYESLKSQGTALVADPALRGNIVDLYEEDYGRVANIVEVERGIVLDLLRPHYLKKFRDMRFSLSATPLDYEALLDDVELRNTIDYRLEVMRQADIHHFGMISERIAALIQRIDAYVGPETR